MPSAAGSAGSTGSGPGFDLGLRLRDLVAAQPELVGVVLGGHGVISWADTSDESERLSLSLIEQAERYLAEHGRPDPFGPPRPGYGALPDAERRQRAAALGAGACADSPPPIGTSSAG